MTRPWTPRLRDLPAVVLRVLVAGALWLVVTLRGRVRNYVDPFFGSGAVLLARPPECFAEPGEPGTETVNDASRFLANFWRALRASNSSATLPTT